jgi:site-specific DNA-methyltransferase (adenine-specific)
MEIKILNGDCLDLLEDLPSGSIRLLVTDPPYCIGTTSNGMRGSFQDNNLIRPFFDQFFDQIRRVLRDDGSFYVNTDWRTYPFLYPIIGEKLIIRNCIVWDYEWIKAGSHYRFSHEFIIYGTKTEQGKRTFSPSSRDVWREKPINFTVEKWHQAEKPEALIQRMIEDSTVEGDTVLDPFLGSGTTAVVCKNLSRNFIGFEISSETYKVAEKRIADAVAVRTFQF